MIKVFINFHQNPASSHFSGGEHQNVPLAFKSEWASERGPLPTAPTWTEFPFVQSHICAHKRSARAPVADFAPTSTEFWFTHIYAPCTHRRINTKIPRDRALNNWLYYFWEKTHTGLVDRKHHLVNKTACLHFSASAVLIHKWCLRLQPQGLLSRCILSEIARAWTIKRAAW